ncbi:MAG: HAMP domain-containing protein [Deltaproteobacteria bacterium]|nr:HAMP domain-containing protein [Deltaproteobacteria bacterium]
MRRTTLRRRLTLLFGLTIAGIVFIIGWFVAHQGRKILIEQSRRTAVELAHSISASSSNDFVNYNYVALEQKAEAASRNPDIAYVILYDKEGKVAAFTGQGEPGAHERAAPLSKELRSAEGPVVGGTLIKGYEGPGLDIIMPVTLPGAAQIWGTVRLGFRLDNVFNQIRQANMVIFFLGLSGILAGWFISAMFTRRITVPLGSLVEATVQVSEGNFDTRIETRTGDEIQNLADNFNWMVERLLEQREGLERNLKEIRSLKDFSDLVLLSITNGLITLDAGGKITSFNRESEELLGTKDSQVIGRSPMEVWGPDNPLTGMLRGGTVDQNTVQGREIRWEAEDGTFRILEVSTAHIQEPDGPSVGLLALMQDLTEKKSLEEKVRRADRLAALGTFAAGLAHEIRNPLTAVRAFVQMFPAKYQSAVFRGKFNRIVPRELDRVNELLENLLDLVRRPRMQLVPMDIFPCVEQVLETLEPEIQAAGIDVRPLGGAASLMVIADESYLTRAIYNVILNAVQAMPHGGRLTIEVIREEEDGKTPIIALRISDTGIGIPMNDVQEVFNPFFTSKEKGTGLGLAVTNKIIEDQNGSIEVASERGVGTTFTISLPEAKVDQVSRFRP